MKPTMIDNAARRVLMASWLYYQHDMSILPDSEFDRLSALCARRWIALSPFLQWQLGSAEEIAASGFHCKVTLACEGGALFWAKAERNVGLSSLSAAPGWKYDRRRNVRWVEAGAAL